MNLLGWYTIYTFWALTEFLQMQNSLCVQVLRSHMLPAWRPNSITLSGSKLVANGSEAGRRPAASWKLAYHLWLASNKPRCSTCRDSSNLLEAGRRPVRSQIPLRYPGRRQVRRLFEAGRRQVRDQLRTRFEPDSVMGFGFCCTALEQRLSAKLCGVVQGMELWNFAEGAIYIRLGGHHIGHRPTF